MFLLVLSAALAAEPRTLTLDEAMALGAGASPSVAGAEAGVVAAQAGQAQATGGYLPSVGAALSYNHTFLSEYDGLFDSATSGAFSDLPFGKADTWRTDLTLSQVLYGGGRVHGQTALARAGRTSSELTLRAAKASVALTVATAYLDARLADRLVEIATETRDRAKLTWTHAAEAAKVGRQPEFDVLRAKVELDNQEVVLLQTEANARLAHLQLAQALGLPPDSALELTSPLDVATEAERAEATAGERLVVTQAQAGVDQAEAAVRVTRSAGLPQVGVSGTLEFVGYPDDPLPPLDDWRTNLTAGLSVSMPLFNGGIIRAEIHGAEAAADQARAAARQVEQLAELDAASARATWDAARAAWAATSGTVDEAQAAYAIGEVRFQEGISTQAELADARLALAQALVNRARAGRDLQLAELRVRLLPDLPLSTP